MVEIVNNDTSFVSHGCKYAQSFILSGLSMEDTISIISNRRLHVRHHSSFISNVQPQSSVLLSLP